MWPLQIAYLRIVIPLPPDPLEGSVQGRTRLPSGLLEARRRLGRVSRPNGSIAVGPATVGGLPEGLPQTLWIRRGAGGLPGLVGMAQASMKMRSSGACSNRTVWPSTRVMLSSSVACASEITKSRLSWLARKARKPFRETSLAPRAGSRPAGGTVWAGSPAGRPAPGGW
jgi:hypothetical protein